MRTLQARGTPSRLKLRRETFERLCIDSGLNSEIEIARALGLNRSTVWKIRAEQHAPSERFVAGCMTAWPEVDPRDLFATTPIEGASDA